MWFAVIGLFAIGGAGPTGMTGPQGPTGMTGSQGQPGNDSAEQCSQRDGQVEVLVRPRS
jgi:hypothetical protein